MGTRGDGTGHGQQKWGYGWGAGAVFFLNYLQVQPLSALLLAEKPGVLDQEPQLWGALPLLAPGAHVCLTPWPSAGAGAVQQPEPPAATPAPSLPFPCPRRNSLKTTGALLGQAVLLGEEKRP